MDDTLQVESIRRGRLRVGVFVAVAYGAAWLVALPLYLNGRGLAVPWFQAVAVAMMFTPTLAVFVAGRVVPDGRRFVDRVGLKPGPFRRWWRAALQAWLVPLAVGVVAVVLAVAFGLLRVDLVHFSGFAAMLREKVPGVALPPVRWLAWVSIVQVAFAAFVNMLPALGEEIGWRGFLQPVLTARRPVLGTLATGVVWGLWHAPLLLLGYNFPGLPWPLQLLGMCVFTTLASVVLGRLRQRAGTVWVSALAHGSINAVGSLPLLVIAAGTTVGPMGTLVGLAGWIPLTIWAAIVVLQARRPAAEVHAQGGRSAGGVPPK